MFLCTPLYAQNVSLSTISEFTQLKEENWKEVFYDSGTKNWEQSWFLDGETGYVENTDKGMVLHAGPEPDENGSHVVLWSRPVFNGNIRVEYDFTRLDSNQLENNVNILYLHATGSGVNGYDSDISVWTDMRKIPAMDIYFNHMKAFHISYAVNSVPYDSDYVRGRRYIPETGHGLKNTALYPEYSNTGLFTVNKTYHITAILTDRRLYMEVKGDHKKQLFYFDIAADKYLSGGRIGLRQMWTRTSRYTNFRVFEK